MTFQKIKKNTQVSLGTEGTSVSGKIFQSRIKEGSPEASLPEGVQIYQATRVKYGFFKTKYAARVQVQVQVQVEEKNNQISSLTGVAAEKSFWGKFSHGKNERREERYYNLLNTLNKLNETPPDQNNGFLKTKLDALLRELFTNDTKHPFQENKISYQQMELLNNALAKTIHDVDKKISSNIPSLLQNAEKTLKNKRISEEQFVQSFNQQFAGANLKTAEACHQFIHQKLKDIFGAAAISDDILENSKSVSSIKESFSCLNKKPPIYHGKLLKIPEDKKQEFSDLRTKLNTVLSDNITFPEAQLHSEDEFFSSEE